jgi:hypothetical protein
LNFARGATSFPNWIGLDTSSSTKKPDLNK